MPRRTAKLPRLFYTATEVGQMFNVTRQTVAQWCEQDLIPSMRIGNTRMRLIPARWLQEMEQGTLAYWSAQQEATDGPEPTGVESGLSPAADAAPSPGEAESDEL